MSLRRHFNRWSRAMVRVPFSDEGGHKGWFERFSRAQALVIREIGVKVVGWPTGSRPLRVAFLSDFHTSSHSDDIARLRTIITQASNFRPDLVLYGGDYVNMQPFGGGRVPPRTVAPILAELRDTVGRFGHAPGAKGAQDAETRQCKVALSSATMSNIGAPWGEEFPMRIPAASQVIAAAVVIAGGTFISSGAMAQQEFLALHNAKRARHCAPAMVWSPQLAAAAQAYAAQCKIGVHSGSSGENLASGYSTPAAVVDAWYNEVGKYNYNAPGFTMATGHFTQVIWKGSTQLGCGMANCGGQRNWVCRYGPPGNYAGQFPQNVVPPTCAASTTPGPTTKPTTMPTPPPPKPTQSGTPNPNPSTQGGPGNWSAIAVDGRGRWGRATHVITEQAAQSQAIAACGSACRVALKSTNKCVSYAESRANGYWYGVADGASSALVQQAAVSSCQRSAPPKSCRSVGVWCR